MEGGRKIGITVIWKRIGSWSGLNWANNAEGRGNLVKYLLCIFCENICEFYCKMSGIREMLELSDCGVGMV